jgi:hypothetical protein
MFVSDEKKRPLLWAQKGPAVVFHPAGRAAFLLERRLIT